MTASQPDSENSDDLRLKATMQTLAHAPMAAAAVDVNGRILRVNEAFLQSLGYSGEESRQLTLEALFFDPAPSRQILSERSDNPAFSDEGRLTHKSGEPIPVRYHVADFPDPEGNPLAMVLFFQDLSEQQQLKKREHYYHEYLQTLHSVSLGMMRRLNLSNLLSALVKRACTLTGLENGYLYLFDPETRDLELKAGSGRYADMIGFRSPADQGMPGTVFNSKEPQYADRDHQWMFDDPCSAETGPSAMLCVPLVAGSRILGVIGLTELGDGQTLTLELIPVLEEFSSIAAIAIDNAKLYADLKEELRLRIQTETEREQVTRQLHQSQRLESLGTLAGGIAHDFNNILTAIYGYTHMASLQAGENPQLKEDLNQIFMASERAKELIQQILTVARKSNEDVYAIRPDLILKETLKLIRASTPTTIAIIEKIHCRRKIEASSAMIHQIFMNLLTNAVQAMESAQGTITVSMADITINGDRTGRLSNLMAGDHVHIMIADTGTGIEAEKLDKVFEPYYTTKPQGEGTGLGLAVVLGIVKRLGGEITVASEIGQGTCFDLYFPKAAEARKTADSVPDQKPDLCGSEHILFVDDEPAISILGKRMLSDFGYQVTAQTCSLKALELIKQNKGTYDLVISDMTMPGLTGYQLFEQIRQVNPELPMIICTGYSKQLSEDEVLETGIRALCSKPFEAMALAGLVRRVLDNCE